MTNQNNCMGIGPPKEKRECPRQYMLDPRLPCQTKGRTVPSFARLTDMRSSLRAGNRATATSGAGDADREGGFDPSAPLPPI